MNSILQGFIFHYNFLNKTKNNTHIEAHTARSCYSGQHIIDSCCHLDQNYVWNNKWKRLGGLIFYTVKFWFQSSAATQHWAIETGFFCLKHLRGSLGFTERGELCGIGHILMWVFWIYWCEMVGQRYYYKAFKNGKVTSQSSLTAEGCRSLPDINRFTPLWEHQSPASKVIWWYLTLLLPHSARKCSVANLL